jgi:DNA-binding transcriptional LysR family regulator
MSNHSEASGEAQAPDGASTRSTRGTLRIAFVPGVTITKWSRIWEERRPDTALEFLPGPEADQLTVLHERRADISFVRHPIEVGALNAIRLYQELPVVVVASDDPIAELATVTLADLVGYTIHETPATPMPDAIALVAAGVGAVLVPHSVARLHSRKDVVAKQVTDAPETVISIAWLADAEVLPSLELPDRALPDRALPDEPLTALIDEFVGIVRGRSANSSRSASVAGAIPGAAGDEASEARKAQSKAQPKAQPLSAKAQAKATARAKADAFARRARIQQDRRKTGR